MAMTPSTMMPMVPAPAITAGIVKTPVPTMLPITRPVAEVRPSVWAFFWFLGDSPGSTGGEALTGGRGLVMVIGSPLGYAAVDRASRRQVDLEIRDVASSRDQCPEGQGRWWSMGVFERID
jgi:hypothetical protein